MTNCWSLPEITQIFSSFSQTHIISNNGNIGITALYTTWKQKKIQQETVTLVSTKPRSSAIWTQHFILWAIDACVSWEISLNCLLFLHHFNLKTLFVCASHTDEKAPSIATQGLSSMETSQNQDRNQNQKANLSFQYWQWALIFFQAWYGQLFLES